MWLELSQSVTIGIDDESQLVVPAMADVLALVEDPVPGEPESYRIGRIMADRLDVGRIAELGSSVWGVADADSSGLESAWACLLDEEGRFRDDDFEMADPVVYLYRFALHLDFVEWKMAVMHMFCSVFGGSALVLAQHHTTLFSDTEFKALGFRLLPPTSFPAPAGFPAIDRTTRFWTRENGLACEYRFSDYPDEPPAALPKHEEWLEKECPKEPLC